MLPRMFLILSTPILLVLLPLAMGVMLNTSQHTNNDEQKHEVLQLQLKEQITDDDPLPPQASPINSPHNYAHDSSGTFIQLSHPNNRMRSETVSLDDVQSPVAVGQQDSEEVVGGDTKRAIFGVPTLNSVYLF